MISLEGHYKEDKRWLIIVVSGHKGFSTITIPDGIGSQREWVLCKTEDEEGWIEELKLRYNTDRVIRFEAEEA